jgi:uncharacterized protein (DUF983 family)
MLNSPTMAQSAMRGIACRCPRRSQGKLYAGFLTLKSLLIALQFHHKAAEGRPIDRKPR